LAEATFLFIRKTLRSSSYLGLEASEAVHLPWPAHTHAKAVKEARVQKNVKKTAKNNQTGKALAATTKLAALGPESENLSSSD
jgi:hypothetical protein